MSSNQHQLQTFGGNTQGEQDNEAAYEGKEDEEGASRSDA
jgi:hypothetical protein